VSYNLLGLEFRENLDFTTSKTRYNINESHKKFCILFETYINFLSPYKCNIYCMNTAQTQIINANSSRLASNYSKLEFQKVQQGHFSTSNAGCLQAICRSHWWRKQTRKKCWWEKLLFRKACMQSKLYLLRGRKAGLVFYREIESNSKCIKITRDMEMVFQIQFWGLFSHHFLSSARFTNFTV